MKLILLTVFLVCCATIASAQTFSESGFKANLDKTGTLCDKVYGIKIYNDTLTNIYMGGKYPNQKFTIAVKGNNVTLDWPNLTGKIICVTGVFEVYEGRPRIVAAQQDRLTIK